VKKIVFLTGIINILTGLLFLVPDALALAGIRAPENTFWLALPALFMVFLGIILIYSSRDLGHRATVVFWDGMSRVAAFFIFGWFGIFGGMGFMMVVLGAADLSIGLVYFIGLPRSLGRGFLDILLDRR
jgi:hypothetical protein